MKKVWNSPVLEELNIMNTNCNQVRSISTCGYGFNYSFLPMRPKGVQKNCSNNKGKKKGYPQIPSYPGDVSEDYTEYDS